VGFDEAFRFYDPLVTRKKPFIQSIFFKKNVPLVFFGKKGFNCKIKRIDTFKLRAFKSVNRLIGFDCRKILYRGESPTQWYLLYYSNKG
jgi:hypothetical protein